MTRIINISEHPRALLALLTVLLTASILALMPVRTSAGIRTVELADSLYNAGDYAASAEAYRKAVEELPDAGRLWSQYGFSLHLNGQYASAINAFLKARALHHGAPTVSYNLACAHALLGSIDESYSWLDSALIEGLNNLELVKGDSDLESLRKDPRYPDLLKRVREAASPCEKIAECAQLDFWIGDWDVYSQNGTLVGRDLITRSLNGCVIIQQWHSGFGNSGMSMRFWDPAEGRWRSTWVDAQGGIVTYSGRLVDSAMNLKGTRAAVDGSVIQERARITPRSDGTVRHLVEHSQDGGQSWYVYFDGHYVRREATLPARTEH